MCRACRSCDAECATCGAVPERFSTLRAQLHDPDDPAAAETREAFDLFADAESRQLHGAENLGVLLRSMGMRAGTDSELESTAREFSLAGDGRRLSWEGFEALVLTHRRLETVGGETIALEYEVLGVLRDYRRVVGERGVAGLTEAEFGAWLENWEGLLGGVMGDGAEWADRALTVDDIAALECLEGFVTPEDVADMKAELPPDAARQAGGVEAPGAGGSGGEPLAFREAVRRVFQRFGHARCVQGGRVVWIGARE